MGSKEVIDYVMNSPGNTNRAVLSGILNSAADGGESGGGVFDVHFAYNTDTGTWSSDKTLSQVLNAWNSGLFVRGICVTSNGDTVIYTFAGIMNDDSVFFVSFLAPTSTSLPVCIIIMGEEDGEEYIYGGTKFVTIS